MEKKLHELFELGIFAKAIFAFLQIIGGVGILFSGSLLDYSQTLIQNELITDPNDFFANHAEKILPLLQTNSKTFLALYLLSHGVIKLFLLVALYKEKVWAFHLSIFVFSGFFIFQMLEYFNKGGTLLLYLSLLDILVIYLIYQESLHNKKIKTA